jgi:hypothetical protein
LLKKKQPYAAKHFSLTFPKKLKSKCGCGGGGRFVVEQRSVDMASILGRMRIQKLVEYRSI